MNTDIIAEAKEYEQVKMSFKTTDERIFASRKLKSLILGLNEIFKETKDSEIMDLMKSLTEKKKKVEVRLKGRQSA